MTMYFEKDASLEPLRGKTVAIIGYGSQGRAHANNLHESGIDVVVGARKDGKSWKEASAAGLRVATPAEAAAQGDLIAILLPDMQQPKVFKEDIEPNAKPGSSILFAHGFNIHFGQIKVPETMDGSWWRRRARATWCAASSRKARACRASWPFTRTPPAKPLTAAWRTAMA